MMLLILDENPILAANLVPSKLKFKQLLELSQLICSAGISGVYKKIPQGKEIQNWILENPAWVYRYFDTLFIYCANLPNIKYKTVEGFKQIMHDLHWHVKFNGRIYIPPQTAVFRFSKDYITDYLNSVTLPISKCVEEYKKYVQWKKNKGIKQYA